MAEAAEVIFIAVKPQYVPVVLREISPKLTEKHLIVSIAAGVTLAVLTVGRSSYLGLAAGPLALELTPVHASLHACRRRISEADFAASHTAPDRVHPHPTLGPTHLLHGTLTHKLASCLDPCRRLLVPRPRSSG